MGIGSILGQRYRTISAMLRLQLRVQHSICVLEDVTDKVEAQAPELKAISSPMRLPKHAKNDT